MLDALEHCRKRIIIVGDTHQQIYSFRYAIDAMKRFPFDDERDLTMSFRFGKKIADLASVFIREAKDEKGFKIKGNPQKSSRVAFYTDLPRPKVGERCAILSRTNLALFEKALGLRSRGIPFSLEGNIGAILWRILDVYWLSEEEHDKIRDRFIQSFQPDPYRSIGATGNELEVWVNRPRQYVDLLQQITDETFTRDTGIRVKFSIMPDESKLVLANAANIQPDVALGVSTNVPYELAIRNALYDLRSFDDFDRFIRIYSPGSLLSYIINDSVYAIPETQDFWVTFYRRDIMASLGLPIPETWPEVIEILPELQRYGMNYNTPLSSGSGMKGYLATAPYLFNYGADLYSPDGFSTGLGSDEAIEAIKFMAESFTLYGMPLTTSSFYDSFRYGSLPIGVANITTYIQLLTAAPELNGLWSISLYPATVLEDGTQNRYATGSAQASIMFANTDMPQEGWQFMKWWMSTDTQVDFQEQLILNYGLEYLWNSANLEAFSYSPIPDEHKAVILEQWQWLQEPVKLPGSYMEERELSNAWNKIVFDGVNPRVAIDNAVIIINREITRKMEEFGYLRNGVVVQEFKVPTIEMVRKWMEDAK
ncbi:MAG: extracellular solute-binding protein [Anaerolineales bacterium]|nr:extracellular solute-binding protein [Anaerolineales bacterium]